MEGCHFVPFHFAPQCHFATIYHEPFCPRDYVWRKRIMSTIISPVAQSNDVKICSGSTTSFVKAIDVKTGVNWFIKRVIFRFYEILKTWSVASLISMYDAEQTDDRNQVDVKIDPRHACFFFQNTRCSILPHVPFFPDLLCMFKPICHTTDSFQTMCPLPQPLNRGAVTIGAELRITHRARSGRGPYTSYLQLIPIISATDSDWLSTTQSRVSGNFEWSWVRNSWVHVLTQFLFGCQQAASKSEDMLENGRSPTAILTSTLLTSRISRFMGPIWGPGPLFTKRTDVLPQNFVKSRSREIRV